MVGEKLITLNDVYEFDVGAGTWAKFGATVGELPTTRYFHAFVAAQDSFFIYSGLNSDGSRDDSIVDKYGASLRCSEECMPGTFRQIGEITGATACVDCVAGKFSDIIAAPLCGSCPAGVFSFVGSSACT